MSAANRARFACIAEARAALTQRGYRPDGTASDGSYIYCTRDGRTDRVIVRKLGFLDVLVSPIAWNYDGRQSNES